MTELPPRITKEILEALDREKLIDGFLQLQDLFFEAKEALERCLELVKLIEKK